MAVYNGATYISAQLDSLARQTLLPMELVVTDDGSTDDTLRILGGFAKTAPFPVRIYRNEQNLGYANNFLHAASLCRGELIAFCDQDDVWFEQKLERCRSTFTDPEVLLCVHSAELWNGQSRSGQRCPGYDKAVSIPPLGIHPLESSYGFAMLLRREVLALADNDNRMRKVPPPARPLPHDQWVWFLAAVFGKIVLLPDILVLYRQHESNVFGGVSGTPGLAGALQPRNYARAAHDESCAAQFLTDLSQHCQPQLRERALAGASLMRLASTINANRVVLYAGELPLLKRVVHYLTSFAKTRYAIGKAGARLGWRAAAKDLVFGVIRGRQAGAA